MKKKAYILLTVSFFRDDEKWIARCDELKLSSFGDTVEEAIESIEEFIKGHLETLGEVGELEKFLWENNVLIYPKIPRKLAIDVPIRDNFWTRRQVMPLENYVCA